MRCKVFTMFKRPLIVLTAVSVVLMGYGVAFARTPEYDFFITAQTEVETEAGATVSGSGSSKNFDPDRWVDLMLIILPMDRSFDISLTSSPRFFVDPWQTETFDFEMKVGDSVCDGSYRAMLILELQDYDDGFDPADVTGAVNTTGIGHIFDFTVESGILCNDEDGRNVFHDVDGDGVYEPDDGETLIQNGNVYLYDESDTLVRTTDLAVSGGRYFVPASNPDSPTDYYLITDFGLMSGGDLDASWYENVFVNRTGSYSSLASSILFEDISNYSTVLDDVAIRSRNTDQSGDWGANTLSIGPDDKDQVISPIRWDMLVADEDFKYADLDYDGRIDPDDKDHIISPLYWDFPN